jgi:hypothetical protein
MIESWGLLNTFDHRGRRIPHPAMVLVDIDGIVRYIQVETNYRVRPEASEVIREVARALKQSEPAQQSEPPEPGFQQTQADAYTRYELLEPSSQSFRIIYDVTATASGAAHYFNPIRVGSTPTVHGVTDLAAGKPLEWKLVEAEEATKAGLRNWGHQGQFIQVTLARPVPDGGEGRIRIDKTYKDAASYTTEGDRIVFQRTLGVRRNSIVLPEGYELVGCNYPSQVEREADGRIRVSFMNRGPAGVPLRIEGRRLPRSDGGAVAEGRAAGAIEEREPASRSVTTSARADYAPSERAFQDREIVYFLQQPETHSFRLYHDYTESRPGIDRYLNVVRPGSRASNPSALVLDTGEALEVETLRGDEITAKGIEISEPVNPETEVVVIWFEAVKQGESKRLRIEETYTDAGRYGLEGDELLWDRSFGRNRNVVVLPPGWYLTRSTVPAVVDETESGEIRLSFENDRPGVIEVLLRARRRS